MTLDIESLIVGIYIGGILGGGAFGYANDGHKGRPAVVNMLCLAIWPVVFFAGVVYALFGVEQ